MIPSLPVWRSDDHIAVGAAFSEIECELAACDEQVQKEWHALDGRLVESQHPLHNNPRDRFPGLNYLIEGHLVSLRSGEFIHASKIDLGSHQYIATQAPLRETIANVWQMVFEQQASLIVNLVHAHEMDAPTATHDGGCAYYWPPNRASIPLANGLTITLVAEISKESYVERRFRIIHKSTGKEHHVTHLHYPHWLDAHPTEPSQLHALIRRTVDFTHGPMVVHCREGIGRTGTFIATHFLLQNPQANAFEIVTRMRTMRTNMVGTIDQYRMVKAAELLSRKHDAHQPGEPPMKKLFFVIGASGSGKTTASKALQTLCSTLHVAYFDSIGVPSLEEMVRDYGSGEGWQRGKTIEWVATLKSQTLQKKEVLLDGQTRPLFIHEACKQHGITEYTIILLDCKDHVRKIRLEARGQPELFNDDMVNWAAYLRKQAQEHGCTIIDTTAHSVDEMVQALYLLIQKSS